MLFIIFIRGFKMKVSLTSGHANCKVYGLQFDLHGVCESDKDTVQSLLDAGVLVEVKPEKKLKK